LICRYLEGRFTPETAPRCTLKKPLEIEVFSIKQLISEALLQIFPPLPPLFSGASTKNTVPSAEFLSHPVSSLGFSRLPVLGSFQKFDRFLGIHFRCNPPPPLGPLKAVPPPSKDSPFPLLRDFSKPSGDFPSLFFSNDGETPFVELDEAPKGKSRSFQPLPGRFFSSPAATNPYADFPLRT